MGLLDKQPAFQRYLSPWKCDSPKTVFQAFFPAKWLGKPLRSRALDLFRCGHWWRCCKEGGSWAPWHLKWYAWWCTVCVSFMMTGPKEFPEIFSFQQVLQFKQGVFFFGGFQLFLGEIVSLFGDVFSNYHVDASNSPCDSVIWPAHWRVMLMQWMPMAWMCTPGVMQLGDSFLFFSKCWQVSRRSFNCFDLRRMCESVCCMRFGDFGHKHKHIHNKKYTHI